MATITTISSTNSVKNSRTTINTNFTNLNSDKVEATQVVMLTGNQSVAGVKTFSSLPQTSTATPSTNIQLVSKGHLNAYAMPLAYKSTDGTLATNTNSLIPTEKAVKTYADTKIPNSKISTDGTLATNTNSLIPTEKAIKTYADALSFAGVPDASEATKGKAEIATQGETNTGTNDTCFITPLKLATSTKIPAGVQTALNAKIATSYIDTDGTLATNTNSKIATQQATKTYVDTHVATAVTICKVGVSSHDVSITGAQTIAHGLGKTPKLIRITSSMIVNTYMCWCSGSYNGTSAAYLYYYGSDGATNGTGNTLILTMSGFAGGAFAQATAAVDATNITLTWAKSGTPTGTCAFTWEAIG